MARTSTTSVVVTCLSQLVLIFTVCLLWFLHGLTCVWEDVVQRTAFGTVLLDAGTLLRGPTGYSKNWFAVAAATTHTWLVVGGVWLGRRFVNLPRPWQALALHCFLVAVNCFPWLKNSFEGGQGVVHAMGSLFFRSSDGANAFALCGSTSTALWVFCAGLVGCSDSRTIGFLPAAVARYLPPAVGFFSAALCFFPLCVPLWNGAVRHFLWAAGWVNNLPPAAPVDEAFLQPFGTIAACAHTICLSAGVLCAAVLTHTIGRVGFVKMSARTEDVIVRLLLCVTFFAVASAWVTFALQARVDHVWGVVRAFTGTTGHQVPHTGSLPHTLVTSSYTAWFAAGVVFEQHWHGSVTNSRRLSPATRSRSPARRSGVVWVFATCGCIASAAAITELRRSGAVAGPGEVAAPTAVLCVADWRPCPAPPVLV
eukprot:TRINITY_DN15596_c0_g1_i1.p1 TRINITY_DN15596_c0_g1~~TRINITY_DN15596_c0_g1_i1.p1  ORF type:complete len:442 (+),score=52.36 TRINITY_DN15596_c0_g1_i1:55-1326(+)